MSKINIPEPTGEYAVGTFTYTVKNDREEVMKPGTMRSIAARVYYPVDRENVKGRSKAVGLSENMIKGFQSVFMVAPDFKKNPEANLSHCYTDAERIPGKKFPLIMFNHGYNSYREGNSFLCIDLASHGYVVISVAHSMEGLCTEFDDGSYLLFDKSITKKQYEPMLGGIIAMYRLMKARGTDGELAQKFDEVQNQYSKFLMSRLPEWVKDNEAVLEYAKQNLTDMIDFEKGVGVSGHSMGGNTAYALCARNPDFVCGINLDGALFGDYTEDILTKPFMQISCADNEYVVTRVYIRHTKTIYKVLFRDMKHIGFADAKHILPLKSMVGKLDADLLHKNLCKCHTEFFDVFLKGDKDNLELGSNDVITVTEYSPDIMNNNQRRMDDGFKENYQYVFAQGGLYGANQNEVKCDPDRYAEIVKRYFKEDTPEQIRERLGKLSTEGCGYAVCVNAVFLRFYGREEWFRKRFGFPMFTPQGTLNFNDLLVDFYCATDNHNNVQGEDRVSEEEDKKYKNGYGTTDRSREWRFELYMKQHGVPADVKTIKVEPEDIEKCSKDGPIWVSISPTTLYDRGGKVVYEKEVGHSMSVVGVAENGLIKVSSWGKEYYIKHGTYPKFETYQQVRFSPKALMVVDMQEMTVGKNHDKIFRYPVDMIDRVNEVIDKNEYDTVIYISHYMKKNLWNLFAPFRCYEGTPQAELVEGLHKCGEAHFSKYKGDAFSNPELPLFLQEKGIKQIEVIGVDGGGCVALTAIGACKAGFQVVLNTHAIGTVLVKKWDRYSEELKKLGAEFI